MIAEGSRVAYAGVPTDGLDIGDEGRVLSAEARACHVQWRTGRRKNEIDFVSDLDLVVQAATPSELAESFESGLVAFAVREVADRQGPIGVLARMSRDGHCAAFEEIAEEALGYVATKLREDPSFTEVLSHLEADEGDELVSIAAEALLRQSFGVRAAS